MMAALSLKHFGVAVRRQECGSKSCSVRYLALQSRAGSSLEVAMMMLMAVGDAHSSSGCPLVPVLYLIHVSRRYGYLQSQAALGQALPSTLPIRRGPLTSCIPSATGARATPDTYGALYFLLAVCQTLICVPRTVLP
jgi:hypothetical protein